MNLIYISIVFILLSINFLYSNEVQWADEIIEYTSEITNNEGAAKNILGKPNVMPNFGYSTAAWMPKATFGRPFESIKVRFYNPIRANQVIINENYFSGCIVSITLFSADDSAQIVYDNKTPRLAPEGNLFNIKFKKTKFEVSKMEIKVNATIAYKGMQIDAAGILMSDTLFQLKINDITNKLSGSVSEPINLGTNINSKAFEIMPIISQDEKTLYFTREKHPNNIGKRGAQDIWYSTIGADGKFQNAVNIGPPLNNEFHNFALSLSTDGNTLFVGNVYLPNGKMMPGVSTSKFNGRTWEFPKQLLRNLELKNSQVNYFLAPNGKVIIMSANFQNKGNGENDLYALFRNNDSSWSEPINLGNTLNTSGMEITPFLAADMTTLYYSTNSLPGYGDYDIFVSRRLDDSWQNWSEPINLGKPFNTEGWDAYLTIPASGEFAYYTSSNNSLGYSDIFKIQLPQELKPKVVTLVSGKVYNAIDKTPVEAKIIYEILSENKEAGIANSNATTGEYKITLPAGKLYGFLAEAEGYLSVNQNIDLIKEEYYRSVSKDLYLVPIKKGANIVINNLFFEFAKFDLLPESYPELDRLADFMIKNSNYNVLISGHTDDVGSAASNMTLSKNRANAVAQYLINKGIEKKRLRIKGFGKNKPLKINDSEENRQQNRRVEFEIQ